MKINQSKTVVFSITNKINHVFSFNCTVLSEDDVLKLVGGNISTKSHYKNMLNSGLVLAAETIYS